jgi:hypothetical protein
MAWMRTKWPFGGSVLDKRKIQVITTKKGLCELGDPGVTIVYLGTLLIYSNI